MCGFCAFRSQLWLLVRFRNFRNGILCGAHAAWDRQGRPSSSSHQPINEWRRPARDSHLITPISGRKKKKKGHARFSPAAAQSGTEGERRASARKRRLFVLEHVFAGDAQTLPDKRGARSACAPPLPPVCSAVAASLCYETSEHTPVFSLFYLLVAHALTPPARLKPEQRWHICGVRESRSNETVLFFPLFFLFLSLSFGSVT